MNKDLDNKVINEVNRRAENFYPSMTLAMEDDPRNSVKDRLKNRLSVGEVIRTRADKKGMSYNEVALQPKQFSPWNDQKKAFKDIEKLDPKRVAESYDNWDQSENTDLSKGATHFYNPKASNPSWKDKGVETARVGKEPFQHIFKKDVDVKTRLKKRMK